MCWGAGIARLPSNPTGARIVPNKKGRPSGLANKRGGRSRPLGEFAGRSAHHCAGVTTSKAWLRSHLNWRASNTAMVKRTTIRRSAISPQVRRDPCDKSCAVRLHRVTWMPPTKRSGTITGSVSGGTKTTTSVGSKSSSARRRMEPPSPEWQSLLFVWSSRSTRRSTLRSTSIRSRRT